VKILLAHIVLCAALIAQDRLVTNRVSFLAGTTVYVSAGRKDGLADSCKALILKNQDTVAVLSMIAVSSKSSSWSVDRSSREIVVGDVVTIRVHSESPSAAERQRDSLPSAFASQPSRVSRATGTDNPAVDMKGRISLQYAGVRTEDSRSSSAQPGISVSMRAVMRDLPVQLIMYGTHRRSVRGSLAPWESSSRPESRLYRFSLEYDDTSNVIMAGRIYPMSAPTVSSVDGISYVRRFGRFFAGVSGGLEPSPILGRDPGSIWKGSLFAGYQTTVPFSLNGSMAYSRSYLRSVMVREAVSATASMYTATGFSVYGFGDFDLRPPSAQMTSMDPSLTSLMLMGNMRISSNISVFAGIDAARSVPSVQFFGVIPDSLFDRTLRAGLNAGASVMYAGWNWMVSFAPRVLPAEFSKEYSGTTSIGTYDLLKTGLDLRGTMTMNENAYSAYRSYGLHIRRTVLDVDLRLRGQFNTMHLRQSAQDNSSSAFGLDAVLPLTRSLSLTASLDAWRGAGLSMDLLYLECSWRF
jgi:hypothetical protein